MADEKTIEQRVSEIIVNQLNVNEEQITPGASFLDDLGADSLDTVELIMAFEEEFGERMKNLLGLLLLIFIWSCSETKIDYPKAAKGGLLRYRQANQFRQRSLVR